MADKLVTEEKLGEMFLKYLSPLYEGQKKLEQGQQKLEQRQQKLEQGQQKLEQGQQELRTELQKTNQIQFTMEQKLFQRTEVILDKEDDQDKKLESHEVRIGKLEANA